MKLAKESSPKASLSSAKQYEGITLASTMTEIDQTKTGHGTAVAEHAENCSPPPKWAGLFEDQLIPLPRRRSVARDMMDQAGVADDRVLVRDYGGTNDVVLDDTTLVDLAEGNVFRLIPRCEAGPQPPCADRPKLAFVCDDLPEVTVTGKQTGHSLKRLFGLPDDALLFRDLQSPNDTPIADNEIVHFEDGCVFTSRCAGVTVKVNKKDVHFAKRRKNGLQIKQTAIAQDVKIEVDFVLHREKPDGNLGPVVRDDEEIILKHCDAFNCVAPDDNS